MAGAVVASLPLPAVSGVKLTPHTYTRWLIEGSRDGCISATSAHGLRDGLQQLQPPFVGRSVNTRGAGGQMAGVTKVSRDSGSHERWSSVCMRNSSTTGEQRDWRRRGVPAPGSQGGHYFGFETGRPF
jgi:hypothetical protein